jgi:acyl-coenzyme A thioesterase PaaI-like protein
MTKIILQGDNKCFVCGKKNPDGLQLDFIINREDESISTEFTPTKTYQGFVDIIHGGIITTVLDEAMVKLAFELGINAVTAKMEIRFRRPVLPGERLKIIGKIIKKDKKWVAAEATAARNSIIVAEAKGMLMKLA